MKSVYWFQLWCYSSVQITGVGTIYYTVFAVKWDTRRRGFGNSGIPLFGVCLRLTPSNTMSYGLLMRNFLTLPVFCGLFRLYDSVGSLPIPLQ